MNYKIMIIMFVPHHLKYKLMQEFTQVVLVDEEDNEIGVADKLSVHNDNTPLHRGFSVFLFNNKGKFLIQKRSSTKKTWPDFWSNSFCGHPMPNETYEQGCYRHAEYELGIKLEELHFIAKYRYKFILNNIMENEICPIYLASFNGNFTLNKNEVEEIKLLQWSDFLLKLHENFRNFSPWCIEEVNLLKRSDIFKKFIDSLL